MPTTAETARIHEAMTEAQGDRVLAAEALGMTPEALTEAIRTSRELSVLWGRPPAVPTQAEAYNRDRLDEPIDLTPAVAEQEHKLRRLDWEGLGVSDPGTVSLMRRFEGFAGGGLNRTLDAMYGGMCFAYAQVSRRFEFAARKLDEAEVKMADTRTNDADKKTAIAEHAYWHTVFMDCAREMQKFSKEATNAGHTRLLIADKAKKMKNAAERLVRRPAWQRAKPAGAASGG